jgi:hypothetical protein
MRTRRPAAGKKAAAEKKKSPARRPVAKKLRAEPERPRESSPPALTLASSPPEPEFVSPLPALPLAAPAIDGRAARRVIFIDVENTSSEEALIGALAQLNVDHAVQPTEVVAVGNWRVISQQVARMLAKRGARLLHTAPSTGVKDWSDLSIAVSAGVWLGRSLPGDSMEIVSADRAFDAIADAAANLGVRFRRLTYASPSTAVLIPAGEVADEPVNGRRRRRGRRRRGGRPYDAASPQAAEPVREEPRPREEAPAEEVSGEGPQGASHQQILAAIARLTARDPARGVNLDVLIQELKHEGFSRPAGSPRLVTRLRKMKDVEVSTTGMVRLVGAAAPGPAAQDNEREAAAEEPAEPGGTRRVAAGEEPAGEGDAPRRRRRGGRRRRQRSSQPPGGTAEPAPPEPIAYGEADAEAAIDDV